MLRLTPTILIAAALLSGCATAPPPPLTADSPASPDAPAGATPARHSSLRPDDATLKSRAILGAAAKADEQGPASDTPMKHDAMPGMDHSQMKGMKP